MRISLSFEIIDFNYLFPIIVKHRQISENSLISTSIMVDGLIIAKIEFTSIVGLHEYSLKEWQFNLINFFNQHSINLSAIILNKPFFNTVLISKNEMPIRGELLFIIESVIISVIKKFNPQVFSEYSQQKIKINALYSANIAMEVIPECIKIKIRPTLKSLEETKAILLEVIEKNPSIILRLDGNRSFELRELIYFVENLEISFGKSIRNNIEYLEEPLRNPYDYYTFFNIYPYPQAIDESLLSFIGDLSLLKLVNPSTHFIIKPSLIGISKSFELMNYARLNQHNAVISSTYETLSALYPLLFLASNNPKTFHGLDTLKYLPKKYSTLIENYSICL